MTTTTTIHDKFRRRFAGGRDNRYDKDRVPERMISVSATKRDKTPTIDHENYILLRVIAIGWWWYIVGRKERKS